MLCFGLYGFYRALFFFCRGFIAALAFERGEFRAYEGSNPELDHLYGHE